MWEYWKINREMGLLEKREMMDLNQQKIKMDKFSPDLNDFINNYNKLKSAKRMGVLYGISSTTILNFAKEIRYVNKYRSELSKEEIQKVVSLYGKEIARSIAKRYNVSKSYITKIWRINIPKENRIPKTKYKANYSYFENCDSRDKAYFIGWLMADGCIYRRKNNDNAQGWTILAIHQKDENVLNTFTKYTESTHNILRKAIEKEDCVTRYVSSLTFVSDKMCKDLSQYGVISNKTANAEYKNIPDVYTWDFIRGYFEGDGGFTTTTDHGNRRYMINMSGNFNNMNKILKELKKCSINCGIRKDNRPDKYSESYENYNLRIGEASSMLKFMDLLYGDCQDMFMNRKYDKYLEIKDFLENKHKVRKEMIL